MSFKILSFFFFFVPFLVYSRVAYFSIRHDYTITSLQQTLMRSLESIINTPPGSGQAVGWGPDGH